MRSYIHAERPIAGLHGLDCFQRAIFCPAGACWVELMMREGSGGCGVAAVPQGWHRADTREQFLKCVVWCIPLAWSMCTYVCAHVSASAHAPMHICVHIHDLCRYGVHIFIYTYFLCVHVHMCGSMFICCTHVHVCVCPDMQGNVYMYGTCICGLVWGRSSGHLQSGLSLVTSSCEENGSRYNIQPMNRMFSLSPSKLTCLLFHFLFSAS